MVLASDWQDLFSCVGQEFSFSGFSCSLDIGQPIIQEIWSEREELLEPGIKVIPWLKGGVSYWGHIFPETGLLKRVLLGEWIFLGIRIWTF